MSQESFILFVFQDNCGKLDKSLITSQEGNINLSSIKTVSLGGKKYHNDSSAVFLIYIYP